MRENADVKARRYLAEGRLVLEVVTASAVRATVRGDGALHRVTWDRGRWACSCPARGRCSHMFAVGLVTAPERGQR